MTEAQRYVSTELSHFVGRSLLTEEAQFELLVKILRSGHLSSRPGTSGGTYSVNTGGSFRAETLYSIDCVCFCDIPVADMHFHIAKYSPFGLAFSKTFLLKKGVNPVFYVGVDTKLKSIFGRLPRSDQFQQAFLELARIEDELHDHAITLPVLQGLYSELASVNHFLRAYMFGFAKPFEEERRLTDPANYYMEREWRVHGEVVFGLGNVRRIFIPETYAKEFRRRLPEYSGQLQFV
jgi:hypothetical protein